tara:strand:+ start:4656 stop:5138 length:483 start_codon:yes stop_codon:yes gene_type:complete
MKKILNERNEKLFSRLFENQGIKVKEGDYDEKNPPDKFGKPMKEDETPGLDKALAHTTVAKDLKKMNTRPEVAELITKVVSAIKNQLPNLSDSILAQAVKDVLSTLKDMGDDASKLVGDIGDDIESTFKEVHNIEVPPEDGEVPPEDGDEKKDLDTDSDQ